VSSYTARFGLTGHPLPKNAQGKTFFEGSPGYARLGNAFARTVEDRTLGVLTAEPGVGKTAAIRNLCRALPVPDFSVLYFCNTTVSPFDLYREMATAIGAPPSHRRGQLWTDIKNAFVHMADERGQTPVLIIDQAHHLGDAFLADLSAFLNFTFDSRDLISMWLVGLTPLAARLATQRHAELHLRVHAQVHLEPYDHDTFLAFVEHGLRSVGAQTRLFSDSALELLFRMTRGIPRLAAKILRAALRAAHEREQNFVDDVLLASVLDLHAPLVARPS
jgi:type II secretory pathway predicted ATPase ExeA